MNRYIIIHNDSDSEKHQILGTWTGKTERDALEAMLSAFNAQDDGSWEVHEVTSDKDVIE